MSVRPAVLLLVLMGLLGHSASAQSGAAVQVTARAEPMEVTVGERVVLTVRVEGVPATVVQTPDRPATVLLAPQQRGPQTQHLQGTGRSGVVFRWRFRATEAGTARIQPLSVVVQGEEYTTEPIRVRVAAPSQRASSPTFSRPEGASSSVLDGEDLFVRASATTNRAYESEQVVVEYRLFYRPGIRLRHSRLADAWDAPGFWREELNVASRPTPRRRRVDGQTYETVVLKRVALFPTRAGTLRIDPLRIETEAQGTVQMRRNGPALRGRFEPVQLASQRLSVRVRPLPPGAPPSFDGAVGQFSVTARVDADSAAVGGGVPLTVRVEGTGNLPTLSPPRLDLPDAIEAYEPTVDTDVARSGRRIRGTKTFTYTLVPRSGGRRALPPVRFSYFDPETGRYVTRRAALPTLQVAGASGDPQSLSGRTGDGLPVGDVTGPMRVDEARWVRADPRPLYRQPWAYLALLLPLLGAGGAVAYRRWADRSEDATEAAPDGALDTARDGLQTAHQRFRDGADAGVYDAVERALWTLLRARTGPGGDAAETRAALDRHLRRRDVPDAVRRRLYALLDRCDEAQYAPGASTHAALTDVLDEADTVLDQLDEHLPAPERTPDRS